MNMIHNLDDRFQDVQQRFDYILFGSEKSTPRWKRCVSQANNYMGIALGSMFVRKYFDEDSKNDVSELTCITQISQFKFFVKNPLYIRNDSRDKYKCKKKTWKVKNNQKVIK